MHRLRHPHRLLAGGALAVCLALAACGEETVSESEVEDQAKAAITQQVGQEPKAIDCPGDLQAEVGATMTCVLIAPDDSRVDTNLRVTAVEDGRARFDVKVGTEVRR
jgi:hypothetical protein